MMLAKCKAGLYREGHQPSPAVPRTPDPPEAASISLDYFELAMASDTDRPPLIASPTWSG